MATKLFRQEVIEARRERLTGAVVAATPPGSRLYTIILVVAAAALVALLVFDQYTSRVQVRGAVAHAGGIARIYPPASGQILAVHVAEGQAVTRGTPLVTVSMTQGRSGSGEGVTVQLAELARQDAELARQQELAGNSASADVTVLEQQKAGLAEIITSLERQRDLTDSQILLARADNRRAVNLADEGAGTQRQVEESRAAMLELRLDREGINERIIGQRETLRAIDGQIAARRIGTSQSRSEIAVRRAALAEQRASLARLDRLVLTAPVAGSVSDLNGRVGLHVQPDTSMVTVVPQNSRLEVNLYAPSQAIGFIKPGQNVRLLFDAFPYQKFGSGRGTVIAVGDVPTEAATLDPGLGITEPVFLIRVAIDRGGLRGAAAGRPLRAGMTLSANLMLERRRLWEVFLDPLLKAVRG